MKLTISIGRFILFLASVYSFSSASGANLSDFRGVWAADSAEAVITDSVCIFFNKVDGHMQATLEIPTRDIRHTTRFVAKDSIAFVSMSPALRISKSDGGLTINGVELSRVEEYDMCAPYEMTKATNPFDIGDRLQEWRLGVQYDSDENTVYCEVNTNRHMFIYLVSPNMVYIRAAAARNNNKGTLFFQNIRMMRNNNTREFSSYIEPRNLAVVKNDLEMDNSKFKADGCTFCPDGGIYWSLISFTPDRILLNGCGETYNVDRMPATAELKEWIKFRPY